MNESTFNAHGRLAGKIALITGSTSGIGRGIAREFALQGARVLLSGRDEARGAKAIEAFVTAGVPRENLSFAPADLLDVDSCRGLIDTAVQTFGALDVLVNNA